MTTVGSVGYALARALKPSTDTAHVVVYIAVPTLNPPMRESKEMTRAEADEFAAELLADGSFLGAPITGLHIGPKSAPVPAPVRRSRERDANAAPFLPNRSRKVRASSKEWRGEKDGTRMDRIAERTVQTIPGGFRNGWYMS